MATDPINFHRAEYGGPPVSMEKCLWCGRGIDDVFFRANGEMICAVCVERARDVLPTDDRTTFWRATGAGTLTAIGTSLLYLLLFRLAKFDRYGISIALGALGVGYAIGYAMRAAARGASGRRYQWTAAVLTYAAISVGFAAATLSMEGVPLWAYPLLVLAPVANLVLGHFQEGLLQLFFAYIGIRWAWGLLRPHPLKLTGPERLIVAETKGYPRG